MSDKSIVSCSEMARMVGLSRQRFYQLVKDGVFPTPIYDLGTLRPFYDQELQEACLEVRRRNTGVNGRPVLFYVRRPGPASVSTKKRQPKPAPKNDHADLIDGLKGLGMVNVTIAQVDSAIHELFPGSVNEDQAEVLRAVFLHLKRKESG